MNRFSTNIPQIQSIRARLQELELKVSMAQDSDKLQQERTGLQEELDTIMNGEQEESLELITSKKPKKNKASIDKIKKKTSVTDQESITAERVASTLHKMHMNFLLN